MSLLGKKSLFHYTLPLILGLGCFLVLPCRADTSFEFKPRQLRSEKAKYCAQILEDEALIYQRACVIGQLLYVVPGKHPWAMMTNDGEFFISFVNGYNLLPGNAEKTTVVLQIWKQGKLLHVIELQHLISDMQNLRNTASHFYWGQVSAVQAEHLLLDTVEGEKMLEFHSGQVKPTSTENIN